MANSAEVSGLVLNAGLIQAHKTAKALLNNPINSVILHGDIHHGNILNFGHKGG